MSIRERTYGNLDWLTVSLFGAMVIMGWLNIFAVSYAENQSIFDTDLNSGKQLIWIISSIVLIVIILVLDFRFYETFSYLIYGAIILLLVLVLVIGREVAGSNSWFVLGPIRFQPSEFAKFATALAIAKYLSPSTVKMERWKTQFKLLAFIAVPALLIIVQGDTGTAMVFGAFLIVFYREGFSQSFMVIGLYLTLVFLISLFVGQTQMLVGILALFVILTVLILVMKKSKKLILLILVGGVVAAGEVYSVNYVLYDVLKDYQRKRIEVLIHPGTDLRGAGYNVHQSKIAIGSGGLNGKGFLNGTQTKGGFVPEQTTDFIFCTIGEEHGWIGSIVLISLFITFLYRVVYLAERQKDRFARIFGYSFASVVFFHFAVNISMTIGLFPVVGIPLPFFSYGGSSLWGFTIFLFIFLKLDAHRMQVLTR